MSLALDSGCSVAVHVLHEEMSQHVRSVTVVPMLASWFRS
jgi:hypothetical protein